MSEGAVHIDQEDHAAQNQGNRRPLLGERKDSFMATQSWFPRPTSSRPHPLVPLLWGPSLESAGWGQMVDGPHRRYSWTQATLTQSDLAGPNHTLSCPTYEEQEQRVPKPRPSTKNRSTLVARRKCVALADDLLSVCLCSSVLLSVWWKSITEVNLRLSLLLLYSFNKNDTN